MRLSSYLPVNHKHGIWGYLVSEYVAERCISCSRVPACQGLCEQPFNGLFLYRGHRERVINLCGMRLRVGATLLRSNELRDSGDGPDLGDRTVRQARQCSREWGTSLTPERLLTRRQDEEPTFRPNSGARGKWQAQRRTGTVFEWKTKEKTIGRWAKSRVDQYKPFDYDKWNNRVDWPQTVWSSSID